MTQVDFFLLAVIASACVTSLMTLMFFTMLARAFIKVPADRALVRTGGLRLRPEILPIPTVVMNGGTWVFGLLHEITWVDLRTMAIEIKRVGQDALLTSDLQRVDIESVFYVQVIPTIEGILDAARTLGGKVVDADVIRPFLIPKLHSALRDVVATFTLASLHQESERLAQEIQMHLKAILDENGLMLERMCLVRLETIQRD